MASDPGSYAGHGAPTLEYVYLITVDGTWPIGAIADGTHAVGDIEAEVNRRRHRYPADRIRVWRARVTDVTEMEFTPARTVDAELKPKEAPDA